MDLDDFRFFYEFLLANLYAVLGAAVVGLAGLVFILCITLRPGSNRRSEGEEHEGRTSVVEESLGEQEESGGQKPKRQQTKVKGAKPKAVRKITLPSHPLLAGEFKGHTGAVLSLDFDTSGKYLASCSEGAHYTPYRYIMSLHVHNNDRWAPL